MRVGIVAAKIFEPCFLGIAPFVRHRPDTVRGPPRQVSHHGSDDPVSQIAADRLVTAFLDPQACCWRAKIPMLGSRWRCRLAAADQRAQPAALTSPRKRPGAVPVAVVASPRSGEGSRRPAPRKRPRNRRTIHATEPAKPPVRQKGQSHWSNRPDQFMHDVDCLFPCAE